MENNTPELLPCPFCGSDAVQREKICSGPYRFGVGCTKCLCDIIGYLTEEESIKAWNTRAKDSDKGGNT